MGIQFAQFDGQATKSTSTSGQLSFVMGEKAEEQVKSILYTLYQSSAIHRVLFMALVPGLASSRDQSKILAHIWQWFFYVIQITVAIVPWPKPIIDYAHAIGLPEKPESFQDLVDSQVKTI